MGHYYSEMVSDAELEERVKERKEFFERKAKEIQKSIDEKGLAMTLAELTNKYY